MRMRRLAIAAAILSTLGFSCYNEPDYARVGMSNGPAGSGSGIASIATSAPAGGTTPSAAPSAAPATNTDTSKSAAKKRP